MTINLKEAFEKLINEINEKVNSIDKKIDEIAYV